MYICTLYTIIHPRVQIHADDVPALYRGEGSRKGELAVGCEGGADSVTLTSLFLWLLLPGDL